MKQLLHIPFVHQNRDGIVQVEYCVNPGAAESGLDTIKGLNFAFDLELCKMYPTMLATIEKYEGTGIRTYMAWIQILTGRSWGKCAKTPSIGTCIDMADDFKKLGIPFYSYGNNPAMFDSPCYNLDDSDEKLEFVAESYLVTFPGRWNDRTISFLAGVKWGYEEFDIQGKRQVNILPAEQIDGNEWNKNLLLLREQFPTWNYGEYINS